MSKTPATPSSTPSTDLPIEVRLRGDPPLQLGPMRLQDRPAEGAGAGLPVAHTRCISWIAADGQTANRLAAARIELHLQSPYDPSSQVHRQRCRYPAPSTDIVESQVPSFAQ